MDKIIKIHIDKNVLRIEFDEINQIAFAIDDDKRDYTIILKPDNSYKVIKIPKIIERFITKCYVEREPITGNDNIDRDNISNRLYAIQRIHKLKGEVDIELLCEREIQRPVIRQRT